MQRIASSTLTDLGSRASAYVRSESHTRRLHTDDQSDERAEGLNRRNAATRASAAKPDRRATVGGGAGVLNKEAILGVLS